MKDRNSTGLDRGVITIDGRRGTGKTRLAIDICRTYGACLIELGPLFRLLALELKRRPSLTVAEAASNVLHVLRDGQLCFGPLDYSSPCGLRITLRGKSLLRKLWDPGLDSILSEIAMSPEAICYMSAVIKPLSVWRPLVAVGREAGSQFFRNAGVKFVLTSTDEVREARKQAQLTRLSGGPVNPVDSSEPALVIIRDSKSVYIETTQLPPEEVFVRAQRVVENDLGWARSGGSEESKGSNLLGNAQEALLSFYRRFGLPVHTSPKRVSSHRVRNIASWINEEARELVDARTIEDQADALADVLYFAIGGFVELGLDAGSILRVVHEANMRRKTVYGDTVRDPISGKILKPAGWKSPIPRIRGLVTLATNRSNRK